MGNNSSDFYPKISSRTIAALLALMALVIIQGSIFNWKPADDAYISFRYAANLVDGNGLVFNQGERVEGYTNFLWTILMALYGWVGLDIVLAGMWLSIICACTAVAITWMVARETARERDWPVWLVWIGPLLLACYPGWSYWAHSGMESPLFACLVMLFLFCGSRGPCSTKYFLLTALFGILAALTRWEAVILWPVIVIAQCFDGARPASKRYMRAGTLAVLLVIGFGSYFIGRMMYYGDVMSNTYYAKVGGALFSRVPRGLVYTGELAICWFMPLSIIPWLVRCKGRLSNILLAALGIYIFYVTWTGGDHFAWLRFYMPVLPIAAIMSTELVKCIAESSLLKNVPRVSQIIIPLAFLCLFVGASMRMDYISAQRHHDYVRWWKEVGQWSRNSFPSSYRLAVIPAGVIPYLSRNPILDLMGLTDREIAHFGEIDLSEAPGHQKSSTAVVLKRKPEIILGEALPFVYPPTVYDLLRRTNRKMLLKLYQMPEFQKLYDYKVVKIGTTYTAYWVLKGI